MTPSHLFRFIRNTRTGVFLVSVAATLMFLAIPVYFSFSYNREHEDSLTVEALRHSANRMVHAQTLIDRAKTVPGVVAVTIGQAGSPARFEATIRNVLRMSGIVESVSIASIYAPATVIHRDSRDQVKPVDVRFRPSTALSMDKKPFVGFGDGTLLIREALSETDAAGSSRLWGYLTAEASLADLIQELQLVALVNDGFGVHLRIQWQSGTAETVIFTGGNLESAGVSRSIPLAGNALLTLTVVPPAMPFAGMRQSTLIELMVVGVLLFLLTYHLLRRPQLLEREVAVRTAEIAAEKAALKSEISARIQAESFLERSHALLDSIFEHIPGMIVLKRVSDMRIARINSSGERMLGRSRDFLGGRSNEEIFSPALADLLTQGDIQALESAGLVELPVQRVEMPSSSPRWMQFSKTALRDRDGLPQYILEFGEDLTEREEAERRVASLNRVLMVLSEINQLIIYTRDRTRLLEEARRILQEKGGFPVAWMHIRQGGDSQIIADPAMHQCAGKICAEIENPERRCWPQRHLHCQALDCCSIDLSVELHKLGLQSLIHLPLRSGDIEWGDIGILGAVGQTFSAEEHSLLEELAGNLSFALDALHQEEARRAAEYKLELSARVFENNSEGIIITDEENRIVMVNKAFTTVTGYSPEEVIGQSASLLNSGHHSPGFFEQMWLTLEEEGEWRGEMVNRRKNGEDFPEWLTISQVRNDAGKVTNYVAVFSDLTAHRKTEARLDFLAHYDALTSLPNREHFNSRVADILVEAKKQDKRVAVIYFDLDRFKLINETIGHVAGDQLLIEVSNRLLAETNSKLNLARLGGDQFAVLLPSVDSIAQATQAVQRIQARLATPCLNFLDQEIHLSASVGISIYPDDGCDVETLVRNADSAMYKAIEEGGNTYRFFRQNMNEHAAERVQLESRLHHALERGELSVHFQPFVSTGTGRIAGAEALLRWSCPELGGNVSPVTFIPLLEEIGLIRQVGEWVLHQACAEVSRWQAVSKDRLFVAVNISALQLTADLPQLVAAAIAEHDIEPGQLEIELTESAIMRDAEHGVRILYELKALGVKLSIDDFGTGYSSLSYLKSLPMSTLKIDRSFVLDIPRDPEAVSITRAILALGHALHLHIIAEGVETKEQAEFLCQSGCDLLQGYYFAKALPATEFLRLLADSPSLLVPTASQRTLQLLSSKSLHG